MSKFVPEYCPISLYSVDPFKTTYSAVFLEVVVMRVVLHGISVAAVVVAAAVMVLNGEGNLH